MLLVDLVGWWYARGWAWFAGQVFVVGSRRVAAFFSMSDLLKTLFSPFRQDRVETKGEPVAVKLQAIAGNLVSRVFGFVVRVILLIVGALVLCLNAAAGGVLVILWPLLPWSPVIGVGLMLLGVGI